MKPTKITNRNIMFSQPMNKNYDLNIGLILGEKNNYIIDTGIGSGSVAPVLEYIGGNEKPVIVVNTHCHWDHVFGNWVFENSSIISHALCRKMKDEVNWDETMRELSDRVDGEVRKCLPNITFEGSLCFPDDNIKIFHTPGHSPDCISVYDATDKVLYAGDNIGDTDDEIVPWIATDEKIFAQLIEIYKKYDFKICVCVHNKPQTKIVLTRMQYALVNAWKEQN